MKNTNKKGFTLVELVIVIAVIAILSAVLIPTFTSVITSAKRSEAVQQLKAEIDEAYVEYLADVHSVPTALYKKGTTFSFVDPGDDKTTYTFATKSYVALKDLDSTYKVYLLWDTNGYSIQALKTAPTAEGYSEVTGV